MKCVRVWMRVGESWRQWEGWFISLLLSDFGFSQEEEYRLLLATLPTHQNGRINSSSGKHTDAKVFVQVTILFFFFNFSLTQSGSLFRMSLLHEFLFSNCFTFSPFSTMSAIIWSFHLVFGLPLLLCPVTSMSNASLPTCCSTSFLLLRKPNYLASCTFFEISMTN